MNIQTDLTDTATPDHPVIPSQIEATENHYFPTQVFSYQLDDQMAQAANTHLLESIYAERTRDAAGIQRSNFRALGGWHSHNNLHMEEAYKPLVELIGAVCVSINQKNGYHMGYRLKIGTMWSVINPPGSSNRAHIHPGCLWSGVYYVQTPENGGNIEFLDPRTQNLISPPRFQPNKKRPKACWSKVNFTPKAGKLLIFPSWLYHSVAPNLSTEKGAASERVIISFNLSQTKP